MLLFTLFSPSILVTVVIGCFSICQATVLGLTFEGVDPHTLTLQTELTSMS